ncbi:reverse transcriptase domain-containing protein [Tanacetum coccineum]
MDHGSRNNLPANERVDSRIAYDGRATREEELIIYLAAIKEAICVVLMTERDDFIVERPEDNSEDTLMEDAEELPNPWILFTDGSSCTDGSEAGLILTNLEGMEFTYALRFRFDATNNEAEYEALIAGLKIAEQMGVENLQVPRNENKKADVLRKITSTSFKHLSKQVLVVELKEKSISAAEVLALVEEEGDTWMTPIFKYLTDETLLAEGKKAREQ